MTHPGSGNRTWQDYPSTVTPITAYALEQIEAALDKSTYPPTGVWTRTSHQSIPNNTWTVLAASVADTTPVGITNTNGVLTFAAAGLYAFTGTVWWNSGSGLRILTFGPNQSGFPTRFGMARTTMPSVVDISQNISGTVRVTATTEQYAFGLYQSSGGLLNVVGDQGGLPRISLWRISG